MKLKHLLLLAIAVILSNCGSAKHIDQDRIVGSWKVSTTESEQSKLPFKKMELHFFPDSTYASLQDNKVKFGNWSYINEREIEYGDNKLTIKNFEESKLSNNLTVNILGGDISSESEFTLVEEFENVMDFKKDPFHPDNNKWRLKPTKKETLQEIRTRLSNYILHNAYLLESAHLKNKTTISFARSIGLIKIYQGAVGIVKEDKVRKSWIDCFYDEEDASKAYKLYSSYLDEQGVLRGQSTGDWVKDDYEILMALHSQLEKGDNKDLSNRYASQFEE